MSPPIPIADSSFVGLTEIVARLRAPDGCPWDQQQTHQSLRKHLLEEAYEVLEALDVEDFEALQEELGDLLLQIVMQAQIAQEEGAFAMSEVIEGIQAKLIRRHPHVFGDMELTDVEQVLRNWEHFKEEERDEGPLEGVPKHLPALAQATELLDRSSRAGLDLGTEEQIPGKVKEALARVESAEQSDRQKKVLGDLLFMMVDYARRIGVDPEAELQATNRRYRHRFEGVRRLAARDGKRLEELELEELDGFWEASKSQEP